jgi:hypothetical protein
MIRYQFNVEQYWQVIVYYNVDYGFFHSIGKELYDIGFNNEDIKHLEKVMHSGEAKAVTCSSNRYRKSIILFNVHHDAQDFLNSVVHEAEHIKQAMLQTYNVEDSGEPPAYTVGYLVSKMFEIMYKYFS